MRDRGRLDARPARSDLACAARRTTGVVGGVQVDRERRREDELTEPGRVQSRVEDEVALIGLRVRPVHQDARGRQVIRAVLGRDVNTQEWQQAVGLSGVIASPDLLVEIQVTATK